MAIVRILQKFRLVVCEETQVYSLFIVSLLQAFTVQLFLILQFVKSTSAGVGQVKQILHSVWTLSSMEPLAYNFTDSSVFQQRKNGKNVCV